MATNKKGFILYADIIHMVQHLDHETAGELFKHILLYVNDKEPETKNPLITIAFEPIKQQLKRDLNKWGETREVRSLAGKKSAEARRLKKEQALTNSTSVKSVQQTSTNPTVNDNVNVNVNVKVKETQKSVLTFSDFWILYDKTNGKKKAEAKYKTISETNRALIKNFLPAYKKATPEKRYRKDPTTFLNGEHWNDEIIIPLSTEINYNSPIEANPYKNYTPPTT